MFCLFLCFFRAHRVYLAVNDIKDGGAEAVGDDRSQGFKKVELVLN